MPCKPNELGLLSDDAYKLTFEACGDGSNFIHAKTQDEVARALVTFLWENGYLKQEQVENQDQFLEMMLSINTALSVAAGLEIKEKLMPYRESLESLMKVIDDEI